ncbi:MAG: leucyl aminopeptidase [Micromonosporaceae bacterium]|nr:leucyl aminopeptidase [Micromonosporaceae bacterium]
MIGALVTELRLADVDPARFPADAVVIGIYQAEDDASEPLVLADGARTVAEAFGGRGPSLVETLRLLGATGEPSEVTKIASLGAVTAPLVAAVGLGKASALPDHGAILRRAIAAATRALAGSETVAVAMPIMDRDAIRAVAEGCLLGTYQFSGYHSRPPRGRRTPVGTVTLCIAGSALDDGAAEAARASVVTAAVTLARDWVNTVPNEQRPPQFAEAIGQAATAAGLDVEIMDENALAEGGFGGILAVGGGSSQPPRLVRISYRPNESASTIALVGKGITFDSGGLSIKPAMNMWEMKSDMAGAAAVAATMVAIARLRLPVSVTAFVPIAENMPSGTAYRPGDVLRMRSGKHVEVLNTDAEGRLILADALALACESSPDCVIETSTLTGGQIVALGQRVAGVMGTPQLCDRVKVAGERTGEPAWPMPLPEDVRTGMESDVADISQVNSGMDRGGHMLQGGVFLSEFVPEGIPWAHIDIAGPSYHRGEASGDWAKGATGVPVRTLIDLIEDLAARPLAE